MTTRLYDHAAVSYACFQPRTGPTLSVTGSARPVSVTLDGGELGGYLCAHVAGAPTLFLLHDSTDILADFVPYWIGWARDIGANLFLLDYPGYASSAGHPTFTSCRAAARAGLEFLLDKSLAEIPSVVLLGRGIGAVFAMELATGADPRVKGLVVENGVADVADWVAERVPWDQTGFNPEEVMAELDGEITADLSAETFLDACDLPVLILHTHELDKEARQLADWSATERVVLLEEGDAGTAHQLNTEAYKKQLEAFLAEVAPREAQ
jgi:pimeloyl-ACP methyl ester carboxylesterase